MSTTAIASPNIALIKYWGNRDDALRLPMADSLSMTLSSPTVNVTVDHAEECKIRSYTMGEERVVEGKNLERFKKQIELTKQYLDTLGFADALPKSLAVQIDSHIPPAVGLASSAAVFAGMAQAIRQLLEPAFSLTDEQTSVIARIGSGSAARSVMGGFVALNAGEGHSIDAAVAHQIAPEDHWLLHDIVIIPSHEEKKVGSTEGHAGAHTSPCFGDRLEAIGTRRQQTCIDAVLQKDFEKLRFIAEEDSWDMHHVMQSQVPPLNYLSEQTHNIIRSLEELRKAEHVEVLYTMDAGPTVHCICTDAAAQSVRAFAQAQQGCTIFESHIGSGSHAA